MTVKDEESRFLTTLDQGLRLLGDELSKLPNQGTLSGDQAFKLYDTFGFPVDLTRLIANEKGFTVDEAGFEKKVLQAKETARKSWKGQALTGDEAFLMKWTQNLREKNGPTKFDGYEGLSLKEKVLALSDLKTEVQKLSQGQEGLMILKATPFYAEGGGQVGDQGTLVGPSGQAEVVDCLKKNELFLHRIKVTEGFIQIGDELQVTVEDSARRDTANNHSATHLLHAALREVLGTHVTQAGSLVEPDRLRFDFTHNKALSKEEISKVEELVNAQILAAHPVLAELLPQEQALKKGAMALFGEKYGDEVRVISMGSQSIEFCGGTHVQNTSQILCFKIVSEGGVSAGVRRIEALTGKRALQYLSHLADQALNARNHLGLSSAWDKFTNQENSLELTEQIERVQSEVKNLKKEIQSLKGSSIDVDTLMKEATEFSLGTTKGRWLFVATDFDDRKVLSDLSDQLRDKLSPSVVVVMGKGDGTHPLLVSVSKDLVSKVKAGDLLKEIAAHLGGKGGGRPDFAQGAVPSRGKPEEIKQILREKF